MVDEVEFRSPLGPLGWLVDALFLTGYMRRLLERRCEAIKREAEAQYSAPNKCTHEQAFSEDRNCAAN
jgi:hypothetical protein